MMTVKNILVVDDDPAQLANIRSIVADAGYTVDTANSGSEAIQKAKVGKPDLIFLDIIMPEMDGFQACRQLTRDADTKDIPVIFVTSKNQKADRVWAQMQGGKAYITKPYSADDIIDKLKAF